MGSASASIGASGSAMRIPAAAGAEPPAVRTVSVPLATDWRGGNSAK